MAGVCGAAIVGALLSFEMLLLCVCCRGGGVCKVPERAAPRVWCVDGGCGVRLARSFTSLGSRVIACAVPQRRQTKEANRRGSTGNSVTGLLGRRQESSTHRFCDSAPRLVCEPAQRRAAPCALLASPRHALLVAGALRDASQRFLHRSAVPRRRGRTWTCAPRDPPGHFERARPPFKNPLRTAARSAAQRSRAEF